jgi:hypothetical protein
VKDANFYNIKEDIITIIDKSNLKTSKENIWKKYLFV